MRPLLSWSTCATSADCVGVARQPYGRCLHHLEAEELEECLRSFAPGQAVDLRGTVINADLLDRVLTATGGLLGRARFDRARFLSPARFGDTAFTGDASFDGARFEALASFFGARFDGNLSFHETRFAREFSLYGSRVRGHLSLDQSTVTSDALFGEACLGSASFRRAELHGFASFDRTRFHGDAIFRGARFWRAVSFRRTTFEGAAGFESVRFVGKAFLAPSAVARRLALSGARAQGAVEIDAAGCPVELAGARVLGRLVVRLHDADLDLRDLVSRGESSVTRRGGAVRVLSVERLDAEEMTIDGADLSGCHLPGVAGPEGLRFQDCVFASTPRGRHQLRLSWPPRFWPRRAPGSRFRFFRFAWFGLVAVVAVATLVYSSTPQHQARRPAVRTTQANVTPYHG
ncbi:pentapeptide repeat-containing protein [Acrocarpospora catenulata]|uniref:pentapeptide repeat-containing protein n=1 Tax=Acrocarpospora catenulata TaxID=2836182 RepID=UPI001BDA30C3|nr:pentapeptide repeat-containing protein [Acrocarpospora catenulata]